MDLFVIIIVWWKDIKVIQVCSINLLLSQLFVLPNWIITVYLAQLGTHTSRASLGRNLLGIIRMTLEKVQNVTSTLVKLYVYLL